MKHIALLALLLTTISGCDVSINSAVRSGDLKNDYIEEPLSTFSKKYKNALNVSNLAMKSIQEKDYAYLYKTIFSEELRSQISLAKLEKGIEESFINFGEIKEYKKMQWHFIPRDEEYGSVLYSVKIVKHEKTDVSYVFAFNNDGEFNNIIAIHSQEKNNVSLPGQI